MHLSVNVAMEILSITTGCCGITRVSNEVLPMLSYIYKSRYTVALLCLSRTAKPSNLLLLGEGTDI